MELYGSKTFENLKKAFVTECTARTRYEFVEYGERFKGYEGLAEIVDKIAYQEFNHARMLYTYIQKVAKGNITGEKVNVSLPFRQKWDMLDNLILTAEDEEHEAKFYISASKVAEKEGFKDISLLFKQIANVERKHKKIFTYLYQKLKDGSLYKSNTEKKWICPACGYEESGEQAFEKCPLCEAKRETVRIVLPSYLTI